MDWLTVKEIIIDYGLKLLFALIIFICAKFIISIIIRSLKNVFKKVKMPPTINTLLIDLLKFILWVFVMAIILNILGLKEISLAIGGSIAVMALGLSKSISNVAGDFISGVFLLFDDDFQVGSWVQASGIEGKVESLDIRKTKIRDREGNLHIISNKNVDGGILVIKKLKEDK